MASIPVSVLGFGNSARTFHLPLLLSLAETFTLHSILQRATSTGPDCAAAFPQAKKLGSIQQVLEGPDALPVGGLVVVTTTNSTHVDYARKALESGRHVVVEKPMATTSREARELAALAKSKGLVLAVYQNRRWDGDFLTLRNLLSPSANGQPSALGVPTYYESRFDRYRPVAKGGWREEVNPEEGGGMLWDLGAHVVDQALVLFGPPETVTAFVRNQRGQGPSHVDDDWLCILSYTSPSPLPPDSAAPGTRIGGLRAVLGATCLSAHIDAEQPRFRVEGTRGSYEKRGTDPQENQLKAGQTPSSHPDTFGLYEPDTPHSLSHGRLTTSADATPGKAPVLAVSDIPTLPGRYVDFYANVAEAIGAGAGASALDRLAVKPEQVADATRILELARKSANEGRTVRWDEKED